MANINQELIDLIKKRIADKGYSYTQVEKMAGLGNGVVSHILSGDRGIGFKAAIAISVALDIQPMTTLRILRLIPAGNDRGDERWGVLESIFFKLGEREKEYLVALATKMLEVSRNRDALKELQAALDQIPHEQSAIADKIILDFKNRVS